MRPGWCHLTDGKWGAGNSASGEAGRLAGHPVSGVSEPPGVEPVAEVTAAGRGDRVGQRGRYGIDGGYAGLAVFGVIEAG